ncbi:MAG: SDR family NAD(P)-dependent oxidoreductase [Verrucomicrobiota bacterium]|nr:SDR family NAD(P)-dependent oxidoreductase [Verrucomicrobiota bacterium]
MKRSVAYLLGSAAIAVAGVALARRSNYSFAGKVCLITGGSRGLGLVLARQLCAQGGRVALLARDRAELERARHELASTGGDVFTVSCDLGDSAQIEGAVRSVIDHFGRLDVLINNAGIIEVGPLAHMQQRDFERAMNLHFWAPYHLIMTSLPHLRRAGEARIVNIASIGGRLAVPHLAPYCASKFALVGLSDSMRAELASENIRITTVLPGTMRTGSHVNAQFKGDHSAEYAWFSAAASLPVIAMKAERAAAKILDAGRRGQPSLMMPLLTRAAVIGDALFPNVTGRAMRLVNRFLPAPTDSSGDELRAGWDSRGDARPPRWITAMGDKATAQNNEARP